MEQQFKYLFTPLSIGKITVKNRIFSPPYSTYLAQPTWGTKGDVKESWKRLAYFYEERAKGGVGLILMSEVTAHHSCNIRNMPVLDESHVPYLRELTDRVHGHGSQIIQMIHHLGAHGRPATKPPFNVSTGGEVEMIRYANWAPSGVKEPFCREPAHEVDVEEIKELVQGYRTVAGYAQQSGYDGVHIQGGHGFLVGEFLSSFSNHRKDEYGGPIRNRMRFLLEIINAIRQECGDDFAIGVSFSADELTPGGNTVDDGKQIAQTLEGTGKVDFLDVRLGGYAQSPIWVGDMSVPLGVSVPLSAAIRPVVKIPVFAVCRIKDPVQAEKILADGHADMIGFARALICDPEIVKKAKEGRIDEIRMCVSCNQGCISRAVKEIPIECIQNPAVGYERELGTGTLSKAVVKKKVSVIGGGPAGMKAAEVAAERGHKVVLYERDNDLGGQIKLAKLLPTREELSDVIRHLEYRIAKLGVTTVMNTEVTAQLIRNEMPDVLVMATGSVPSYPAISGIEEGNVINVHELLKQEKTVGDHVVVLDCGEGHWKFAGTVDYLSKRKHKVEAVTPLFFLGQEIPPLSLPLLYNRVLKDGNVEIFPSSTIKSIAKNSVTIVNVFSQQERTLTDIDTVVMATDHIAYDELYIALKNEVNEIYAVGDCVAPRKIDSAIHEGFNIGRII